MNQMPGIKSVPGRRTPLPLEYEAWLEPHLREENLPEAALPALRATLQELGALGAIVLIRMVISFSLNAELKAEQHKPITP